MANARIESWLGSKTKDYESGLQLYAEFGNDEVILHLLQSGKNSFTHSQLIESLRELAKGDDPLPEVEEKEWALSEEEYASLPDAGKSSQKEWRAWYAEMKYLQARLDDPGKDDEYRLQLALKIVALDEQVRESWRKIAYWRKYGAWPGKPAVNYDAENMNASDLIRRRNTVRTYISKFGEDTQKQEKVKAWEAELLLLETKISESESYVAE